MPFFTKKLPKLKNVKGVARPQAADKNKAVKIPQVEVDMFLDIQDEDGKWLEGEVVEKRNHLIFVHYFDWGDDWNEWIDLSKDPFRINDFRTYCGRRKTRLYRVGELVEVWQTKRVKKPCWLAGRVQKIDGKQVLVKYTVGFGATETDMYWFDAANKAIRKSTNMRGTKPPVMGPAPKRRSRPPNPTQKAKIRLAALERMKKTPAKDRSNQDDADARGSGSDDSSEESSEEEDDGGDVSHDEEDEVEDDCSDLQSIHPGGSIAPSHMSAASSRVSNRSGASSSYRSIRSTTSMSKSAFAPTTTTKSLSSSGASSHAASVAGGSSYAASSVAGSSYAESSYAESEESDGRGGAPELKKGMKVDVRDRDGRWMPAEVREVAEKKKKDGAIRQQVKVKVFGPALDRWNEWVLVPHRDDPDDVVQRLAGYGRFSDAAELKRSTDAARAKATFKLGARVIVYQLALPRRWIVGRVLDCVGCQVKVEFAPTVIDRGVKREKTRNWFHTLLDEVRLGQAIDAELMNSGEDLEENAIELGIKVRRKLLPKSLDEGAWIDIQVENGKWRSVRIGEDDMEEDKVLCYFVDQKGDELGDEHWFTFEETETRSREFLAKVKGKPHPGFRLETKVDIRHPDGEEGWRPGTVTEVDGPQVFVTFTDDLPGEKGLWGHTLDGDVRLAQKGVSARLREQRRAEAEIQRKLRGGAKIGHRRPREDDKRATSLELFKFVNYECAQKVPPRAMIGMVNIDGMTSYMNAILQVMCSVPSVVDYFLNTYVPPLAVEENDRPAVLGEPHDFYPTALEPPKKKDRAMKYLERPDRLAYQVWRITKRLHSGRYGVVDPAESSDALLCEPLLVQQDAHRREFPAFKEKSQDIVGYFEAIVTILHRSLDDGEDINWPNPAPWDADQDVSIPMRADLFWKYFKKESKSFMIDIFHGILTKNLGCCHCKSVQSVFEPMKYLHLKIPCPKYTARERKLVAASKELKMVRPGIVSIHDCLGGHFRLDPLDTERPIAFCNVCQTKRHHMRRNGVARFPNVLPMFFNRANQDFLLRTRIAFPIHLSMKKHLDFEEENAVSYTLVGVINLAPPGSFGVEEVQPASRMKRKDRMPRFTSYVRIKRASTAESKRPDGARDRCDGEWDWVQFTDDAVRFIDEEDVRKPDKGTLMLMYERIVPLGVVKSTRNGVITAAAGGIKKFFGRKNASAPKDSDKGGGFHDTERGQGPSDELIQGLCGSSSGGKKRKRGRAKRSGPRDYAESKYSEYSGSAFSDATSASGNDGAASLSSWKTTSTAKSGRSQRSQKSYFSNGSNGSGRSGYAGLDGGSSVGGSSSVYSGGSSAYSGRSKSSKGSKRSRSSKRSKSSGRSGSSRGGGRSKGSSSRGSSRSRSRGRKKRDKYDDYEDY